MNGNFTNKFLGVLLRSLNYTGLIILLLTFNSFTFQQANRKKIVVIDPGHGGKDSGARGKHAWEKDIVLKVALKLGALIEENLNDIDVFYTRNTDEFIELNQRAAIANKYHADLFISIHANSSKKINIKGAETYAMGIHKTNDNLEVALKENAVIALEDDFSAKYEGYDPNSAESYIIFSLMQNTYLDQSLKFASLVQKEFSDRAGRTDRGVRQAGFLVLWNTSMPGVLVELGFISNAEEEAFLISENGQDYLASAIYRAVKTYFINTDKSAAILPDLTKKDSVETAQNIKNNNNSPSEIYFTIQISSSSNPTPLKSPHFKGLSPVTEIFTDNMYKYIYGKSLSLKEIKKVQKKIQGDFPDAFIIAIENNRRIPLAEAIEKLKE